MGKNKRPLLGQILNEVEIIDAAAEGKSVARVGEKVVFVNGGVPGDVADIQITSQKRRFLEGYPIHFHKKSEYRTEPFCQHFGTCGGCKWQNMRYERQLHYKQKQVFDNFTRIGHLEFPEIMPILGAPDISHYRNKLEFTFSTKEWLTPEQLKDKSYIASPALGFHVPGRFDKVMRIENCHLMQEPVNSIRNSIYQYAKENELPFFDLREQKGLLRNVIMRSSNTGEFMLILVFSAEEHPEREKLMQHLVASFPQITSLFYVLNGKKNDTIFDLDVHLYHGKDHMTEEMEGLKFKVGPKSFYQTNSEQAYHLYRVARDFAGLTGSELVYDLYTGTGTIANFVARNAKQVIGIEYIEPAIVDARINSAQNNIANTLFYAGDMKDVLTSDFIAQHGKPDVIITDPPRAGMHPDVVEMLLQTAPEKIVYVSCNPATQARDLALMKEHYKIEKVQPVDMFPQTHHVENVVLLKKL
jgi:23S rRNA (uracil1939-C5)-methyltransferase